MPLTDRELGMGLPITRRDFMNGTAMAIGAFAMGGSGAASAAASPYPPALTGMRGHHAGSFEAMHALRDKAFFETAGTINETGEKYDLIIVGAGISGLAAAFLYRQQAGRRARILLIDNHDDFGGHAKRNEFTASNGKMLLGYGGSQSLQTPSYFSPAVKALLRDLGVHTARFNRYHDSKWYEDRNLGDGFFFAKEAFGTDRLVRKAEKAADWVHNTPLSAKAQSDLIELIDAPKDYFPGLDRDAKLELMATLTYADFLKDHVKADPQLQNYFALSTSEYFGCGIDAVTCADAWGNGNPGFDAMGLGDGAVKSMSPSGRLAKTDPDDYIFHFPDGNASIARLLVRALVPGSIPGRSMEDIVLATCDYAKLDTSHTRTRIRLNATVVRVQHEGIVTADAERSKDFYCRVFGWTVLDRPAFKAGGYWIGTQGIFPQIHIIQTENVPPGPGAPISPVARHTAFEVADYDAMKATLEREGITYIENTQPGGRIQMLCNDPDGNTLEFQPTTV